jgi:acyl dehydratase/catechol 2,3-dioxygenase-like lactoylglutathione lyase family enzyme
VADRHGSFVEHVAVRVRDINWHIAFFRDVLGMPLRDEPPRDRKANADQPQRAWLSGGILLVSDPAFEGVNSPLVHIGVIAEDAAAVLQEARARGVSTLPDEPRCLTLPDGINVEVTQAAIGAVASLRAVKTRPGNAMPVFVPTVERYYEEVSVGDRGTTPSATVTEEHVLTYAALTGDYTPEHIDEDYARTTPFGTRIAHGLFGLSLADGLKTQSNYRFYPGISLGWTWDFVAPLKLGDTVHVDFRITSMRTTKRPGWGIVVIPSELINQNGEVIQRGEHRLMILRRPS